MQNGRKLKWMLGIAQTGCESARKTHWMKSHTYKKEWNEGKKKPTTQTKHKQRRKEKRDRVKKMNEEYFNAFQLCVKQTCGIFLALN